MRCTVTGAPYTIFGYGGKQVRDNIHCVDVVRAFDKNSGAALATSDDPGWSGEWLGVPMFFSGFDPAANRANLIAAGFTIDHDEIVEMREPDGAATFQWVVARRPAVR